MSRHLDDELSALFRATGLSPRLRETFDEEELSVDLLRIMSHNVLASSLKELGLTAAESALVEEWLHARTKPASIVGSTHAPVPEASFASASVSDPQPVVICCDHGLCNRLRAILSHREIAQREGRKLFVVWQCDRQCNGDFLDCFAPLPGVRFLRQPPPWYPAPPRVNHCHQAIRGTPAETATTTLLKPSPSLHAALLLRLPEGTPFIAVHIRRTDMAISADTQLNVEYARLTTDAAFDDFLESYPEHQIYVATDCGATLNRFAEKYAARLVGATAERRAAYNPWRHRQTSLQDAVMDLFLCARSTLFMGSYGSSFSDTIAQLRASRGTVSPADRHTMYQDADWAARDWAGPALRELRPNNGGGGGAEIES